MPKTLTEQARALYAGLTTELDKVAPYDAEASDALDSAFDIIDNILEIIAKPRPDQWGRKEEP